MRHADFVAQYRVPVSLPDPPRPKLVWSRRGEGRVRSLIGQSRRRVHGRRLAYLDSHFPWRRSGFRYADALALHDARPDTVFFSMYELRDPFPAPVLPLAQFPRVAPALGITDVYGVFLDFMGGILGLERDVPHEPWVIEGLDLSGVLAQEGIRTHVGLLPGGGFVETEAGFAQARRLVAAADQVFSWAPAAIEHVAGVIPIAPSVIDTSFYVKTPRDFADRPLELLFVADAKPRKGLDIAMTTLVELAREPVHLHVVGPHDRSRFPILAEEQVTFHGWLEREELRALHGRCHVFLSPVTAERGDDPTGDGGITDGFPTGAAVEAASSGLLLLSANPDDDHRNWRPGTDYVQLPATVGAFADAVRRVLADPRAAVTVAESGAARVRERLDVRRGARERLALMGFGPGRTPYVPKPASRPAARGRPRLRPTRAAASEAQTAAVAMAEEVRALAASLEQVRAEQRELTEQMLAQQRHLADELQTTRRELMTVGQLALDDEWAVRRALEVARASPAYETPFVETNPLVSVCIATYTNVTQLIGRSIPSVLAQDYQNIEIVVVGDNAPPETAAAIAQLDDPRIRYENLSIRGPYPEAPDQSWLVAGTGAINRALQMARGAWIAVNDDDDALRPHHISTLLTVAQSSRDEVVYGRLVRHAPDGPDELGGVFPPVSHGFGWQLALQHRAMRLFEYKLAAALFGHPGDWDRARRMIRAGVRFRMVDEVVMDYYPAKLWRSE
jgi:glycosyltransferase involved in cell wall biosynthesis